MSSRIQDLKFKLSNQHLAAAGGVLCIGALAWTAYKYWIPTTNTKTLTPQLTQEKSFQETYREVIMTVQQSISKHQTLNGEAIKCILRNQYKLAQYEYKSFIFKVRNQRRKLIKDKHEYRRAIMTMDAACEELMDKNLNAILAHFNIEKTHWIETVELWSSDTEENKEEWGSLLVNLEDELLDSLRDKNKHPLSFKKLNEIFQFKIHTLQNLNQSGLDLDSSITSDEQTELNTKHALIEKYIQDMVFSKFGVEEEDIAYSEEKLGKDEQEKIFTIDDEFTDMIGAVIYGDEGEKHDDEYGGDGILHRDEGSGEEDGDGQNESEEVGAGELHDEESTENSVSKSENVTASKNQEEEEDDEGQYY